ncbi:MAG: SIS domain-containing protein, partial [Chlamydiota bacterium]
MQKIIEMSVDQAVEAALFLKKPEICEKIGEIAEALVNTYRLGGKVLIAGNGGSLADACHFAEELVGFYRGHRPPLPAMALSEPCYLTCVANDEGYDVIFARALDAFGTKEDTFIALSTSGNSANIVQALQMAKKKGLKTVALLGKNGGKAKGLADLEITIEGFSTSDRIQ